MCEYNLNKPGGYMLAVLASEIRIHKIKKKSILTRSKIIFPFHKSKT